MAVEVLVRGARQQIVSEQTAGSGLQCQLPNSADCPVLKLKNTIRRNSGPRFDLVAMGTRAGLTVTGSGFHIDEGQGQFVEFACPFDNIKIEVRGEAAGTPH